MKNISEGFKKIAILGLSHHPIAFDNLCYLFGNRDVKLFLWRDYVDKLKENDVHYYENLPKIISRKKESLSVFMDRIKPDLNKYDLVIIPTLRIGFDWFAKNKFSSRTILFIHCLNFWAFPDKKISFWKTKSIKDKHAFLLNKSTRYSSIKNRLKILEKVDFLNFHDKGMKDYWFRNKKNYGKNISTMPYSLYIPENLRFKKRKSRDSIVFVVPGTIDPGRRDYCWLMRVFSKASKKTDKQIRLILLGRLKKTEGYANKVKHLADRLSSSKNLEIIYFDTERFIPQQTFDTEMINADVIMSSVPLSRIKIFKHYKEVYGETTACHWIDVMRFAKPGIFPVNSFEEPLLDDCVLFYKNERELIENILKMTRKNVFEKKKTAAKRVSEDFFSREKILERFWNQLIE